MKVTVYKNDDSENYTFTSLEQLGDFIKDNGPVEIEWDEEAECFSAAISDDDDFESEEDEDEDDLGEEEE